MSPGPVDPGSAREPQDGAGSRLVIDWDEALARMDGDVEMLREICSIFEVDAVRIRVRLTAAAAAEDLAALQFVAHNLKGASATLSAAELSGLAGQLEQAASEGRKDEARALAAAALAAFDRLMIALQSAELHLRRSA